MEYCPACGGEVPPGGRYCEHCGADRTAQHGDRQDHQGGDRGRRQPGEQGGRRQGDQDRRQQRGQGGQQKGDRGRRQQRGQGDNRGGQPGPGGGPEYGSDAYGGGHERGPPRQHDQPRSGDQSGYSDDPAGYDDQRGRGGHGDRRGQGGRQGHAGQPGQGGPSGDEYGRSQPAGPPSSEPRASLHERKRGVDFAISYPHADGWKAALVSGLLLIGTIVIVPLFVLVGYSFRVGRAAALGAPVPPEYDDWGGLLVDGFRLTAVGLLLGVGAAAAFFGVGVVAGLTGTTSAIETLVIPVYLVVYYVAPAFLTAFIGADSIGDTFTDGNAVSLLTSGYYLKAFLWAILLYVALGIIAAFSFITIVGWIWVYAYIFLAQNAFWGYVYYQAHQRGIVDPPARDDSPPRGDDQRPRGRGQPRPR